MGSSGMATPGFSWPSKPYTHEGSKRTSVFCFVLVLDNLEVWRLKKEKSPL